MKRFLIALQFLTILPVNIKGRIGGEDLGRALLYFPAIGLLIGLLLAGLACIFAPLPGLVMSALVLAAWTIITGGLHLDGFADTCDGLYGGRPKKDALRIMRDSRIGTMGAAGVALILLFKFAALSSFRFDDLWRALFMAPAFARWSQAFACSTSGYAREEGKAGAFIKYANRADIYIGALFILLLNWFLIGARGIVVFALSAALICLFIQYVKRRIGGMTGDTIGAVNELAEAAVLLFSLILSGHKI